MRIFGFKKFIRCFAVIVFLVGLCGPLRAQEARPITLDEVANWVQTMRPIDDITQRATERGIEFALDEASVTRIKEAGGDDKLISRLFFVVAKAELKKAEYEVALAHCNEAIARDGELGNAYTLRGGIRMERKEYKEAESDLETALKFAPDDREPRYLRAKLYFLHLERFDAVEAELKVLLSGLFDPRFHVLAADFYAICKDEKYRNPTKAVELAKQACERTSNRNAAALDSLAQAHAAAGQFDRAVKFEEMAIKVADDAQKPGYERSLERYRSQQTATQPSQVPTGPALPAVNLPGSLSGSIVESIAKNMLEVRGGKFQMGSDAFDANERPVHGVQVDSFRMAKHELTNREYCSILGISLRSGENPDCPVENVSWDDAAKVIKKLNELAGGDLFRLPTEAEWEYAARGGKNSEYGAAESIEKLADYAWFKPNAGGQNHPVGGKKANEFGIFDLSGNVWEWCSDAYGSYAAEAQVNPRGPASGHFKICRGGSHSNGGENCRPATRFLSPPDERRKGFGFRLVMNSIDMASLRPSTPTPSTSGPSSVSSIGVTDADPEIAKLMKKLDSDPSDSETRQKLVIAVMERAAVSRKKNAYAEAGNYLDLIVRLLRIRNRSRAETQILVAAMAQYAWILCTAPDEKFRDGVKALEYAKNACALTQWNDWYPLLCMAVVHAEMKNFDMALKRVKDAISKATSDQATDAERAKCEACLKSISSGQPVRES